MPADQHAAIRERLAEFHEYSPETLKDWIDAATWLARDVAALLAELEGRDG